MRIIFILGPALYFYFARVRIVLRTTPKEETSEWARGSNLRLDFLWL